ncbi:MerR family transcriptional regulator [Ochrobactrum chromiisoli]|uniref:MerR family transcriptional regulator n=1 Tax=Ochrobactrum chromiisoli TaxID=2993941 RepID=A0ABT3QLC1_9HYPH|nr:MerR family transcriptional regulator [Ochrobactrum chromiisoli]MCX2696381.1 MerR family transcriptional regulator [Ochrobactrum chromiisoli]
MAKGYSDELRQQVIAFINEGNTVRQAAEKFGVSPSFAAKVHKKHADQPEAPLFTADLVTEADQNAEDDGSVTALELAEMIGVSKRAISDYAERGIIVKTGRNRFDFRKSVQGYCEHIRTMAAGRGGENVDVLATERARLAREQADQAAMKNAAMRKELIMVAEVRHEWVSIARRIRNVVMSVPSRCRQMLPHLTTYDVDLIDTEIRAALAELGDKDDDSGSDDIATSSLGGVDASAQTEAVGLDREDSLPS